RLVCSRVRVMATYFRRERMSPSSPFWCATLVAIPMFAACGGGGGESPPAQGSSDFITCDASTVKVVGTLSGNPVDIHQSASGSGFSQLNGGDFCTQCFGGSPDPSLIAVTLHWSGLVADGDTADANGNVVMPSSGPRAGETLCSGAGTRIRMANQGEPATLQFV